MPDLCDLKCTPCREGTKQLRGEALEPYRSQLPAWDAVDEHHLSRTFKFRDFRLALAFVNQVGELADEQGHHPDIFLTWGRVRIDIWTHKIDGLTESDFVLAAKIDKL